MLQKKYCNIDIDTYMKKLLKLFEKINKQYQNKRTFFKQRVLSLKEKNNDTLSSECNQLINHADQLVQELKNSFLVSKEGLYDSKSIATKIHALKNVYKQLIMITKSNIRQWIEAILTAFIFALVLRNFVFGLYHVPTGSAEPNILVGDRLWGNKAAYFYSEIKHGDLVIFDNPTFEYNQTNNFKYLWQKYIGIPIPFLNLEAGPDNWVKRVIAVPGDIIEGKMERGKTVIYLNGKLLDEPYVNQFPLISIRKSHGFIPLASIGPIAIPSFLRFETKLCHYTYDPSKPYDQQPYYVMNEKNIIQDSHSNEPELQYPFTPTYDHHHMMNMDVFGPYILSADKYWVMGDSRKNSVDSRWWLFLDKKLIHGRASFVIYSVDSEETFWLFDLIKHPINFWSKNLRIHRFFKNLIR